MSRHLYRTATFKQPSATVYGPYNYTRGGNPTCDVLERKCRRLFLGSCLLLLFISKGERKGNNVLLSCCFAVDRPDQKRGRKGCFHGVLSLFGGWKSEYI